jgi:hypothetical protein
MSITLEHYITAIHAFPLLSLLVHRLTLLAPTTGLLPLMSLLINPEPEAPHPLRHQHF